VDQQDLEKEWRDSVTRQLTEISARTRKIELKQAREAGWDAAFKWIYSGVTTAAFLIFGAWIEWKFNRLN
jgi:hypothetical protein